MKGALVDPLTATAARDWGSGGVLPEEAGCEPIATVLSAKAVCAAAGGSTALLPPGWAKLCWLALELGCSDEFPLLTAVAGGNEERLGEE